VENYLPLCNVHAIASDSSYWHIEPNLQDRLFCLLISYNSDSHLPTMWMFQAKRFGIGGIHVTIGSPVSKSAILCTNCIIGIGNGTVKTLQVRSKQIRRSWNLIIRQGTQEKVCILYVFFFVHSPFLTLHCFCFSNNILGTRMFHHCSQLIFPYACSLSPTSCWTAASSPSSLVLVSCTAASRMVLMLLTTGLAKEDWPPHQVAVRSWLPSSLM